MKRVIALLTVLVLCFGLACPVLAADFVPSITEKDHPAVVFTANGKPGTIVDSAGNEKGELDDGCILITPVSKVRTSEEPLTEAQAALLALYEDLTDGTENLPYEKVDESINGDYMVVRDLFDVSLVCEDHTAALLNGDLLAVTFDLGLDAEASVVAMVYNDGQWYPAVDVVNQGNGEFQIVMDRVGAVALSVPTEHQEAPEAAEKTNMVLWIVLMVAAVAVLVGVVIFRRKSLCKK